MRIGPCMCGDLCCPFCGPAQGNWRCPICGTWASEVCEHISEDGDLKQEFHEQARKLEEERRAEEEMAKAWEEEAGFTSPPPSGCSQQARQFAHAGR
jgi:hypothetical protein